MPERESGFRTVLVAGAVALGCSLIVTVTVTWLRPIQLAYSQVERNRAVLDAAGLAEAGSELEDSEVVDLFLELDPRLVDLDAGRFALADASMIAAYDYRAAADDPDASREIPSANDIASLGRRPLLMPVYLKYSNGMLEQLVLPVFGQGMWSTIHGHVVLDGSLQRIARLSIAEHGETPGIGDRIENPEWLARWSGIAVPADQGVDGITGATVTTEAVQRLVRFWLGADGYGPFLAWLREQD